MATSVLCVLLAALAAFFTNGVSEALFVLSVGFSIVVAASCWLFGIAYCIMRMESVENLRRFGWCVLSLAVTYGAPYILLVVAMWMIHFVSS